MIPTEHLIVGGASSAAIALIGSVFNAVSLLVLCGDKRLRSNPTTLLVIFLSISNLIYTSLVLPLNALAMLKPIYMEEHPSLCQFFACLFYWSFASLLFLEAALALNRFQLWGSWLALGISWLGALLVFLPSATNIWGQAGWDENSRTCTLFSSSHSTSVPFSVLIASVVLLPFFVIIMCYIAIVCTLKASHKRLDASPSSSFAVASGDNSNSDCERRRKERGLTLLVCAILTNYLICTVPGATVLAVDPSAELLSKAHIPTYMVCWFGVIINPLLYVLCNPAYRASFYARFSYSGNL